ncbi:hypothetical protein Y1Q_0021494 [Alligator mississippiensis]|uniref:DDE Tnp4 domain-containing protein n=1 Tax=Alligator mississippiensis TaxID=8496 RepID=A0A151PAA3_ALLMI|nr:hypothetical protein Y1Q_0021494 [Alligator mississippiensis]
MNLTTPSSFSYIAIQYNVGKSTARERIREVGLVIQNLLANCFIHLVSTQVVTVFCCMGFPSCIGAIDRTHIPILYPPQGAQVLINHKGYLSVILQGIVKHQDCLLHIFSFRVGNIHAAHIFHNSPLSQLMENRYYAPGAPPKETLQLLPDQAPHDYGMKLWPP